MCHLTVVKYAFKFLCVLTTLAFVGLGLSNYYLDEDISVVDAKSYFESEEDVVPVLSLCFVQTFDDALFSRFGKNITGSLYQSYLLGEYFDEEMLKINYHSVTTNVTDFVISYDVEFFNGSEIRENTPNIFGKSPYYIYTWESWNREILKCFAFEITKKGVSRLRIIMKRDIFPNKIRPYDGGFAALFHYPNQVLKSFPTVTRQWQKRERITNYYTELYFNSMNVVVHRFKEGKKNCLQNWKDFDKIIIENHVKSVGCKTPDQITEKEWKLCKTKEKMKQARVPLKSGHIPACREIDWFSYRILETDSTSATFEARYRKWKDWVSISFHILNPRFTITMQKKKVDFQNLVGYVGGYIGLFMGLALFQLPDTFVDLTNLGKKFVAYVYKKYGAII